MGRTKTNQPGRIIFIAGVAIVLASTALGFYLAHEAQASVTRQDFKQYLGYDARFEGVRIRADESLLSNVHALMWMSFGLGVGLTLVGLKMLTRPNLDFHPSPPLGSIRDAFEKTKGSSP